MAGFAFDFSGHDIDDDAPGQDSTTGHISDSQSKQTQVTVQPQRHNLDDLLASLPSQISFSHLKTNPLPGHGPSSLRICRRELFDVRAQLMAEDTAGNEDLIAGLDEGDLTSGIYEGGFKTWECSLDMAQIITESSAAFMSSEEGRQHLHCIELGAGTAMASSALLSTYLGLGADQRPQSIHMAVCDYNEAVLRLVSLPNLILAWHKTIGFSTDEGELEIDDDLIKRFMEAMNHQHVSLDFISGAWGPSFSGSILNLMPLSGASYRLVLASETIYNPSSLNAFTRTLQTLLGGVIRNKALVAAKKIYFGVGGGVDEFCRCLQQANLRYENVLDVRDAGVGRVILEVRPDQSIGAPGGL